ncbi:hypothetical protein KD146_17495 [Devosia sp. BSSL-BM10]|uniref:Uncharacterized protein n=1 Tax=Devosia litorisediminis TaxID=2829817 RepID=A0A942EDY4_9HYPH|nr:hypothetical protein [Devosia litorisediminis]MBS3850497.1 hypothetical protein [Devosia litorisediminis]
MNIAEQPTSQVDADRTSIANWLDEEGLDWIARAAMAPNDTGLPELRVWPSGHLNDFGQAELVGRCQLCGQLHQHSLGGSFHRLPHCSMHLPPFSNGASKPLFYVLRPDSSAMPEDIAYELSVAHKRVDLLNQTASALRQSRTANMLQLRESGHRAKMPSKRKSWSKAEFEVTFAALIACGVVDERAAMMAQHGSLTQERAGRNALAAYIRDFKHPVSKTGANSMRRRLCLACFDAHRRVGRGEC